MIRNKNGYINDTAFPLYYFGHGLSYTSFRYGQLTLSRTELTPAEELEASIEIENTGNWDGAEVVQFYFSDPVASMVRPTLELAGFQRVFLKQGEKKRVTFRMKISQCAFLDEEMHWVVERGRMELLCGGSCVDIRSRADFRITETKQIDGRHRGFYADCAVEPL